MTNEKLLEILRKDSYEFKRYCGGFKYDSINHVRKNGYEFYVIERDPDGPMAIMLDMYDDLHILTDPKYRGQGIWSKFFKEIVWHFLERDNQLITIKKEYLRPLFKRAGFVGDGHLMLYRKNPEYIILDRYLREASINSYENNHCNCCDDRMYNMRHYHEHILQHCMDFKCLFCRKELEDFTSLRDHMCICSIQQPKKGDNYEQRANS